MGHGRSGWEFTDAAILDQKRSEIIDALGKKIGNKLIKKVELCFGMLHTRRASLVQFLSDIRKVRILIGTRIILSGTSS